MKRVLPLLAFVIAILLPVTARAQGFGVSINPYLGYYGFDESSFEDAFENADLDAGAIWGLRLGLGGHEGLSLDLGYGRSSVDGEFDFVGDIFQEDADIDLFYGASTITFRCRSICSSRAGWAGSGTPRRSGTATPTCSSTTGPA